MKLFVVVALLVCAVGCSKDAVTPTMPSQPSTTTGSTPSPASPVAQPPRVSAIDDISVSGFKDGCISVADLGGASDLNWDVQVHAYPKGIKTFRKIMFHSDSVVPCGAGTNANGHPRIVQTAGPTSYLPGASGVSHFTAPADFDGALCGSNQYDIAIDDGEGNYLNVVSPQLNAARDCAPPPPAQCIAQADFIRQPAVWRRNSPSEIQVTFTVEPNRTTPAHIAIASYQGLVPGRLLPQRLIASVEDDYLPGTTHEVKLPASSCKSQGDMYACVKPTTDLTEANFPEWSGRAFSWFVDDTQCPTAR